VKDNGVCYKLKSSSIMEFVIGQNSKKIKNTIFLLVPKMIEEKINF
jgi:hypothetical protein